MTCVVSPRQHRMSFNSSSSPSSTHSQSHPHQQHASTSAADEEDLLALLGSDTFSLESQRDRDLIKLGSFLSNLIPPPHSSTTSTHTSTSSQPVLSPSTNHFGSPMSFQSSSSGFSQSHLPPAPSSSLNNKPSSMIPPAEFFQGMDFSSFNGFGGWGKECEGLKGGVKESFNQDRWGIGSGSGTPVGGRSGGATPTRRRRSSNLGEGAMWRAPNCSREREERIEIKENEEGGWKGRLRKSTVDQQQPGSGYSSPARRGQQSVREQQVEEEEQRRRNSGNYDGSDVDDGGGGREGDRGQEMEEDDLMMDD